jgi:hypothetical protein
MYLIIEKGAEVNFPLKKKINKINK